jgi:hypothetical protein
MVALPVGLASLFILTLLALQPAEQARREPIAATGSGSAAVAAPPASAARNPTTTKEQEPTPEPNLAELEAKAPASLSVAELLVLNEARAARKRQQAHSLSAKLQKDSELAKDSAVQAELLRLAGDPDTAATALATMAHARSAIGADLLYEVWTSRSLPPATAELARSLLYSRDVRPHASAALAVALELRSAESCEAVQAALPKAASEGDRRSLAALAKLNARRGCGENEAHDCYACLRSQMKPVVTAIAKVKGRRPPRYPATPKP